MTLIVNGTCASELRTRFCPMRFTYSFTTGSCTIFTLLSTCMEYCLPTLISVSSEYQSPRPRPPTLRLPIASTSSLPPVCFTWLGSGSDVTGGFTDVSFVSEESCAACVSEVSVDGGVGVLPDGVETVGVEVVGGEDGELCPAGVVLVWSLLVLV